MEWELHHVCVYLCLSLGCATPRPLSPLGSRAGAAQSGIHNLWAAGTCQGAAAAQHVSTPQGAVSSPTCDLFCFRPSFQPFVFTLYKVDMSLTSTRDFRTHPPTNFFLFCAQSYWARSTTSATIFMPLPVKDEIPFRKGKTWSQSFHSLVWFIAAVFHNKAFSRTTMIYTRAATLCYFFI